MDMTLICFSLSCPSTLLSERENKICLTSNLITWRFLLDCILVRRSSSRYFTTPYQCGGLLFCLQELNYVKLSISNMAESRRRNKRSSTDRLAELRLHMGDARVCLSSAQHTALSWSQPSVSAAHQGTVLYRSFWGLSCPPMDVSCHVLTWKDGMDYQPIFLLMSVSPFVFNPQNTCSSVLGQQTLLWNTLDPAGEISLV